MSQILMLSLSKHELAGARKLDDFLQNAVAYCPALQVAEIQRPSKLVVEAIACP